MLQAQSWAPFMVITVSLPPFLGRSEAATFLDAINTGHSGSFTTLHAHSARKAMDRLALLVMAQGTKLSFGEVIRYLQTSIDVILQMGRQGDRRGIMEMYFPGLED